MPDLEPADNGFESVLFLRLPDIAAADEPECFADLNLDRLLEETVAGREEFDLLPFFSVSLHDVAEIDYRHEVFRDLERPAVRAAVEAFAAEMRRVREHLAQVEALHAPAQRQAWFLDAVSIYCQAVATLAEALAAAGASSRGIRALQTYLAGIVASGRFEALTAEARALRDGLADVRYTLRIQGSRITVSRYAGEADYRAEVEEAFARFRQDGMRSEAATPPGTPNMNHVEARILEFVTRLYPDLFTALSEFHLRNGGFQDETIRRVDRELQFCLAYLELIERLRAVGLPFCYPQVSSRPVDVFAEEAFDLALADALVRAGRSVVRNDFALEGPERIIVVTGPNNGGKTTFARMFGQLHYLAGLGLPVPGRRARLLLADRILTHFERDEDIATRRGKLEDDLVRVREILEQATADSVIVMNETFSSTTLRDALFLGGEVMRRLLALGPIGVYVTFLDELAALGPATVSMVGTVNPENPAERTYRIVRRPADGLAYATAIADAYGMSYERLLERIPS